MGKKRRVLWIGGALVVAVVLISANAIFVGYNSTDARIERAVAQIVAEYGFERQIARVHVVSGSADRAQVNDVGTHYRRAPVDTETAAEIVAILREACPSCKYEHTVYDIYMVPVTMSGGRPDKEVHDFTDVQGGSDTARIMFSPASAGFGLPFAGGSSAFLSVSKFERPSLWQRIKGLWPW